MELIFDTQVIIDQCDHVLEGGPYPPGWGN